MKTWIRSLVGIAVLYTGLAAAWTFQVRPLTMTEEQELKDQQYWVTGCPVPLSRLRVVETGYVGIAGEEGQGQLVVLDALAQDTLSVFQSLYQQRFRITQPVIVETQSMQDPYGYTLGFVCQPITAGTVWSLHSYGAALAVSPIFNPYVGFFHRDPQQPVVRARTLPAVRDLGVFDRTMTQPQNRYFLDHVVSVFDQYGWRVWGGYWSDPIDYMNFNIPRWVAAMMVVMSTTDAGVFFRTYKAFSAYLDHFSDSSFGKAYLLYPRDFNTVFRQVLSRQTGPAASLDEKRILGEVMTELAQQTADNPVMPGRNTGLGLDDGELIVLFPQENHHE